MILIIFSHDSTHFTLTNIERVIGQRSKETQLVSGGLFFLTVMYIEHLYLHRLIYLDSRQVDRQIKDNIWDL